MSLAVALPAAMPGLAQTLAAQSDAPASSGPTAPNPLQVALLHWYKADTVTSFTVGNEPNGVAFDGANIWVANFIDGTVTKLAANGNEAASKQWRCFGHLSAQTGDGAV